ncbi:WLM domain-containing protein [Lasiosphaeria miniovina]|uniref:WLM domain-containing protein n=1 Tax=Lasiosphaeria miniovina TaxID=1954250 RepID=A0AA40BFR0_9PEZI|nr:WLM domain-containing protein [Lasiosphaeria miniovina]KAK0733419.1 WLM domain-containing protein [Lasiosphaeria miniovina]
MSGHDPLVLSFSHMKGFGREKEALHTLKKIASLVKPIMRARGWKVGELAEFYPDEHNLLGLNVNRGQRILLRLRYAGDRTQFLPFEQVADTMLHELSHIVHGPHDQKFHALWNQLRDEHEGLALKGYTGEGFLSDGYRLGGSTRRVPMHEARRLARAAAEKRATLSTGSGRRLGGAAPRPGEDIRRVIAGAIERRNQTSLQGCGNTKHSEREIRDLSDTATRNGFKTQADEDAANDAAIAQALWELVQEDEKARYGTAYIPPSAEHPAGSSQQTDAGYGLDGGSSSTFSPPPPIPTGTKPDLPPPPPQLDDKEQEWEGNEPAAASFWACDVCTLHNAADQTACDACETPRKPANPTERTVIDLTTSPPPKLSSSSSKPRRRRTGSGGGSRAARLPPPPPPAPVAVAATWQCSFCGNVMERQWWTCNVCGRMKDSSK